MVGSATREDSRIFTCQLLVRLSEGVTITKGIRVFDEKLYPISKQRSKKENLKEKKDILAFKAGQRIYATSDPMVELNCKNKTKNLLENWSRAMSVSPRQFWEMLINK